MNKIIAIDPGNERSAYVVWNGQIISKGIVDNIALLDILQGFWVNDFPMAIEMVTSYGMAVGKTVFDTCVWIGRFEQAWSCGPVYKIYRKDVKMHLCQSMRAKDSNIRQALIDRFGFPGTKKNPNIIYDDAEIKMKKDLWSALAVAVTWSDKNEM